MRSVFARHSSYSQELRGAWYAGFVWGAFTVLAVAAAIYCIAPAQAQVTLAPKVIFSIEAGDVVVGQPLPAALQESLTLLPRRMAVELWGLDAYHVDEQVQWIAQQTGRSSARDRWLIVLKTGGKFSMTQATREGKTIWVAKDYAEVAGWQDIIDRLERVSGLGYEVGLDGESTFVSWASCPDRFRPFMSVRLRDGRTVRQHIAELPGLWVYPGTWSRYTKGHAALWSQSWAPYATNAEHWPVRMSDEMWAQRNLGLAGDLPATSLRAYFNAQGKTINNPAPLIYLIRSMEKPDLNWGADPEAWREMCGAYPSDVYRLYPMRDNAVALARLLAAEYDGWQPPPPAVIQMTEVAP